MPTYSYECQRCGRGMEMTCSVNSRSKELKCKCGGRAFRNLAADQKGYRKTKCWDKPLVSAAAGVDPSQIKEAEQQLAAKGVDPDGAFAKNGDMIFYSRKDRKRKLAAIGMHDRDGGYSD